ncbi:hypothetical protein [Hymenobacter cellulosilyticus]|uniref:BZIP transcription factor n=1 Tax=Hymenobacter cellulosilyticus TaxID=2932248 RepID=A0A8T9Q4Z4_9BACT|nr:hypothetical protein [Hymenobacter cellulosilyticus]UOQ70958.1 hypothetical protein MUN79_20105 [Hymenobacter cellulosilyticus]
MGQSYVEHYPTSLQYMSLGNGANYGANLWWSSYIGFNLRHEGTTWKTNGDGGSNGGSGVVGGINGSLLFVTVSGSTGGAAQTVQDADMLSRVRMQITYNGNVQIGTTLPTTHPDAKLSVDGKVVAKSVYVTSQSWADFVFAPTYKPMSLSALEAYLQRNKHLPAIPAASEVETKGYNVGEMDAKLLQSIEELTLHVIELNKQNQKLQARTAELEKALAKAGK